jgi:hypothetical protein
MRIERVKRYKLTLCEGEHDEQTVYANLANEMVELIKQDIRGELKRECLIALENGELVETGIIDRIEKVSVDKWQSVTMGNIVENFSDVLKQIWICLVKHHTLDLKWKYNKNGF